MKVLVVGSGGREHALVWKISQSPKVTKIYCAPGNPGIGRLAELVPLKVDDLNGLLDFARKNQIDLTVVGPEAPLVLGLVDLFEKNGLKIFGPNQASAQMEGSKVFAKRIMEKYGVPTAASFTFTVAAAAKAQLAEFYKAGGPDQRIVIKADGLAAGKGAVIVGSLAEANKTIEQMMEQKVFGQAGEQVVLEEFLVGEEISILAICDGEKFHMLASAQDHKAVFDGDKGPNTGGMGAYSPVALADEKFLKEVKEKVFTPVLKGLLAEGIHFRGVLYAGLMVTKDGPKVLEFNARFGDPETQAILPRLENDLVEVFEASLNGTLDKTKLTWKKDAAVCVVLAAPGYPDHYPKGLPISGLEAAAKIPDALVFHAGTALKDGQIATSGGRVLGVTALGPDLPQAIKNVYEVAAQISFEGMHYRKDIGQKGLRYLNSVIPAKAGI